MELSIKPRSGKTRVPTIACFNLAKTPLGIDLDRLIAALQKYVDECIVPAWGTPARLVKSRRFRKGAWAMVFLDSARVKDAEGIHDLTPDGLPMAKVFVKPTLESGDLVSVCASHELVEMLVDPSINLLTTGPNPRMIYSYESADPVEEVTFKVDGVAMSDFVYPAYFESFHKAGSTRFDHAGKVRKPFQILHGGYQQVFYRGQWKEIFETAHKARRFAGEVRSGHRTLRRPKQKRVPSKDKPR